MKRFAAPLLALVAQCLCTARADIRSLVNDGKVSWAGDPEIIYLLDGTTSTSDSYDELVLKFTDTSAAGTLTLASGVKASVRALVVGGGGAGGTSTATSAGAGGGGGAGGFAEQKMVLESDTFTITVGAGGAAATTTDTAVGDDGNDSSFVGTSMNLVAKGGGGGGAQSVGRDGGSGGGGSRASAACVGGTTNGLYYVRGNDGGRGGSSKYAGGGGGAGAAGGRAGSSTAMGGDGLTSDITGTTSYYAGGGGGGRTTLTAPLSGGQGGGGAGGSTDTAASDGEDGLGGGGGGSGSTAPGGKGGDGVVILRIRDVLISVPADVSLEWDGTNQIGYEPKGYYEFVGGTTNATAAGTYSYQIKPATDFEWSDGTGTETKTVEWTMTKLSVEIPSSVSIEYDGTSHTVASSDEYCTIVDGTVTATNAATYSFTMRLVDAVNSVWSDGTTDDKTTTWYITAKAVSKPTVATDLVYAETNAVVFTEYEGVKYDSGTTNSVNAGSFKYVVKLDNPTGYTNYVWSGESGDASVANATISWGISAKSVTEPSATYDLIYNGTAQNGFASLDWTRYELASGTTNATAGGTYTAIFHLLGNDGVTNYVWSTSSNAEDYSVTWPIAAANNAVTSLSLIGWRVGEDANTPTVTATWGASTAEYAYGFGDSADTVTEWITDTSAITNVGTWVLRAVIPETASWNSATGTTTFVMWDNPTTLFRNWTEITIQGSTTELTNFPVAVRISEARMLGFYYDNCSSSNLLFIASDGTLLPYDVDYWDTDGESIIWLNIPILPTSGKTVTMYWNVRDGHVAPNNDSTLVWSDYVGVWHMGESTAGAVTIADASGHQDGTGHVSSTVASGAFGYSRGRKTTGANGYAVTVPVYDELDALTNGSFTVSGWVYLNSSATNNGYLFGRKNASTDEGWGVQLVNGLSSVRVYTAGGGSYYTIDLPTTGRFAAGEWMRYDFVFTIGSSTKVYIYLNGTQVYDKTINTIKSGTLPLAIGGLNGTTDASTLNGYTDEFRLKATGLDASYVATEYAYESDTSLVTNSVVYLDGLKVNSWVEYPTMDKTTWDIGETKGQITSTGKLLYGSVTNYIYSLYDTSEVYSSIEDITGSGSFRAVFTQTDSLEYQPIVYTIDFRITASKPYADIGGTDGDSGRVLLMSRDTNKKCQIDYQGYKDTRDTLNTFWEHVNTNGVDLLFNLQQGTESILWTRGYGAKLWHLMDCRHGNTYPTDKNGSLISTQNYLPFSSTSKSFLGRSRSVDQTTAGQIVMRNTTDAVVYSPCYTNGIGTIYFDAVNAWAEDTENYNLVVEYATNTVYGLEPTDANCCVYVTNVVESAEVVDTNWYGNLNTTNWHAATMRPFVRNGTEEFVETNSTTELSLAIATGGSADRFYRIVVPIDYLGAIRFRIRRTTYDSAWEDPDKRGHILLDNIIASPPAMGAQLESPGHYDGSNSGNQQLGWELATSVPYPAISDGEVTGYAVPKYYANADTYDGTAVDTNAFIASAFMHYRWRYLTQTNSEWQVVELAPGNGFKAVEPIELPDFTCDFEYWYEAKQQAPFYTFVDFTGLGKTLDHSEERGVVTNVLNSTSILASSGTNWFFRVRDGHSDYRSLDIVYTRDTNTLQRVPMMLVGDHIWRGFIKTPTNSVGDILYRIEGLDRQTGSFAAYAPSTNYWQCTAAGSTLPISDKLEAGSTNTWSTLTLDAVTGYVMFQIDDEGLGVTIVHADYQNFNYWSDARRTIFVGSSTEDSAKSGTSPSKQTFVQDFDSWSAMPASDAKWKFTDFSDISHLLGRNAYESFSQDTDGLWAAGPGMWVSKKYRLASGAGVALQMEGCGKGYLQLNDTSFAPRGIETVTFNARLGQFIGFDDFNYYMGAIAFSMTNYTFMTRCAFDLNKNQNFAGNASLSLVADHLPNKGCYEARWEWVRDMSSSKGGQRLCLYRWNVTAGKKSETLLAAWTNVNTFAQVKVSALSETAEFMPFYITVSNDTANACTWVAAGVRNAGMNLSKPLNTALAGWYVLAYRDSSTSRLTRGSYGVLSANCEGVFGNPQYTATAIFNEEVAAGTSLKPNKGGIYSNKTRSFPGLVTRSEGFGTDDTMWNIQPGRMTTTYSSTYVNAIVADPAPQDLEIYLTSAGSSDWGSVVTNISLSGFGGTSFSLPFYSNTKSAIRFKSGAAFDDPRTDIVIDTVSLTQFRGDDYSNDEEMVNYIPDWQDPYSVSPGYGLTNWVFTSAWITGKTSSSGTDGMMLLSARRTRSTDVSSIRSPLMDGYKYSNGTKRGIGLGMVSFDYADAQTNAVLLVQIATNGVYSSELENFDTNDDSLWETVETIDFSTFTDQERASGTLSSYIGVHGINGLMRIVVDPALVTKLANVTDTTAFGEVKIGKVVCRDEPQLDSSCWWGWNLRTIGATLREDTEKKMYLPDLATDSEDVGMSLALNYSATDSTDTSEEAVYKQYVPFVQTPTFTSDIVGEVSFKARKYDTANAQPASVTLYGSKTGTVDSEWKVVTNFVVSGDLYQTYSYRTDPGTTYAAFRLGVSGAVGVENAGSVVPSDYSTPVRVLIEEVFVSEAVRTRMAFKNVGAFRSDLSTTVRIKNVPSKSEQPLCNEGWGVQCEVYPAQLGSEIDTSRDPVVYLHWFEGTSPWGFENWRNLSSSAGRHSARLAQVTDTNMVFRSSYLTAPDAIIGMSTRPGTVVQYMLEVRYYQLGSDVVCTNYLTASDWTRPSWYTPIDYNADFGGNAEDAFSAYNILDTVAPGWAWINEVNIHGKFDDNGDNTEANAQFVEVAVPVEADISGWYVRFLDGTGSSTGTIVTNVVAEFGTSELPGMKTGNIGAESNMVFRVIACPKALTSGTLKTSDGTLDDTWSFGTTTSTFLKDGRIFETEPFGIQLVRASGVVEHEIVCIGTNFWGSVAGYEQYYSPTNTVEFFKKCMRESAMFYAGADEANVNASNEFRSLGVFESSGETSNQWNNVMKRTPGRINEGQSIDPDHPTPNGETIVVFCNVDTSFGHVYQTVGEAVETDASQTIFMRRGSGRGTNIVYKVDPWYQLDTVTTNGTAVSYTASGDNTYVATVGVGASNSFTVVATAKVNDDLENIYGITDDNRYRPAVMDWLAKRVDLKGNAWSDQTACDIKLADFINANDVVLTNLNLTQMYWLDMDPTVGDLALKGYVSKAPSAHYVTGSGGQSLTNLRFDVFMQITNRASAKAWTPYALRGLAPGSSSLDYTNSTFKTSWTSETFKAVGFINNGHTGVRVRDNWVPLRWFVFVPSSFRQPGETDAFTSTIEVVDPFSPESPAYEAGWYEEAQNNGKPQDYYFWCLDERIQPISVEILQKESIYDD